MKHLDRSMWIIVACLALAAPLAWAQDGADGSETEVLGSPDTAAPDGDAAPAADTDGQPADGEEPTEGEGEPEGGAPQPGGGLFNNPMLLIMIAVLVLFFVMSSRGRKKREGKHREMLASLKKGDKVTSIGGICGTIIEVKEDEITVKVDETNNVRMRFARWAIRGVGDTAKSENPEQQQQQQDQK